MNNPLAAKSLMKKTIQSKMLKLIWKYQYLKIIKWKFKQLILIQIKMEHFKEKYLLIVIILML